MSEVLEKPVAAVKKEALILSPARMALAEQKRQDWVVDAEAGTKVEQVLDPQYWAHMASLMQQFDHIEVRLETGEWVLDLMVTDVGRNYAHVKLRDQLDLGSTEKRDDPSALHEVRYLGSHRKHGVVRISDGAVIQEGISKKLDAQTWMTAYENTTAK